jgi:metal-responsive CopG/Arc/MetJ family transcriptional regulator
MRKKIPEENKKKTINLTINPYLNDILDKHIKEKGINKSKFIEKLIEEKLKNNK